MKIGLIELNWKDQEPPRLEAIAGNECAKRALEVALVGGHCVAFISTVNSPAADLVAVGARIAKANSLPFKAYVAPVCPCGGFGSPKIECRCSVKNIEVFSRDLLQKIPDARMFIETIAPRAVDTTRNNEDEDLFTARVLAARGVYDPSGMAGDGEEIMLMAIREINVNRERVTAVAKTIARMSGSNWIGANHVAEAVQYVRNPYGLRFDDFQEVSV